MTDYELKDMGLARGEIDLAVRGCIDHRRRPTVDAYLASIDERGKPTWPRLYRSC